MKLKYFLFTIVFVQVLYAAAQVGINKENPEATLDVSGDVLVRGKLYLENPGRYTGTDEVHMLVMNDAKDVRKYDVEISDYGPINYAQYVFNNVSSSGLSTADGYNTQINANNYTLAVHGFSYVHTGTSSNTSVTNRKTSGNPTANRTRYIEGQQFYAFVQNGTWRLRGFVNNSPFYNGDTETQVNIKMDVIIYRNDFITKIWPQIRTVDMNNQATGTASLPTEFAD